jgi:hypothetical protein
MLCDGAGMRMVVMIALKSPSRDQPSIIIPPIYKSPRLLYTILELMSLCYVTHQLVEGERDPDSCLASDGSKKMEG